MKKRVFDTANLKRDTIINNVLKEGLLPERVSDEESDKELADYKEASKHFENYLADHGKRHTPERAFILKKVYEQKGPVDIQTLYEMVCKEEGQVALSTIYNNLSLLVDARLVRRLDLVNGAMAFFEKTLGVQPHGYLICQRCGKIKTIQLADVQTLLGAQLPKNFLVTDLNLQVNGLCRKCQTLERKEAELDRKNAAKGRENITKAVREAYKKVRKNARKKHADAQKMKK